ncbi:putative leucine-rich repeat containing protein [Hibiscus syriacus]|uniref:Leucine-rich repeat containing protein n=1 Tax=Hibiscus syriacus TaxID=106335 RepID=A0A6A2XXI7_HIBSY|nr:remorin 4.2-like [Hibiscus syriacus]KAE8671685.1 putative leucine-rich repeat containing protein [Hibiscus syriacus]
MLTLQSAINNGENDHYNDQNDHHDDDEHIRDIHALTPPHPPPAVNRRRWDTGSRASSSSEIASSENFTTMSREFNALVLAGSSIENNESDSIHTLNNHNHLTRIGEDHELREETNPLAIVPDNTYSDQSSDQQRRVGFGEPLQPAAALAGSSSGGGGEVSVLRVKKEEVESKISAWQNAKVAKINNRFKREDAVINGWESEQVQKATSWMKKVERKLEEKRVKALEKMQNNVAKAHRKAEERRASAEAKRGTKVAKVLEIANLMRAVGRPPAKRSFF